MCGIAGIWNYRSGRPVQAAVLAEMTERVRHRGPDEDGLWVEGDLGLGVRRLRVVDLEGGRQPMANEDGSVRAVFNGEIYNHRDVRRKLVSRGHLFATRSDTEAVVHAYEEWGERCVERFNGMFALAAWDARRQRLLLARDRLGIKPLYVHRGSDGIAFASELKALMAVPGITADWNLEALDDFLTYEYVPAPASIVRGVEKLRPASTLLCSRGSVGSYSERCYWSPTPTVKRPPASPKEAAST